MNRGPLGPRIPDLAASVLEIVRYVACLQKSGTYIEPNLPVVRIPVDIEGLDFPTKPEPKGAADEYPHARSGS